MARLDALYNDYTDSLSKLAIFSAAISGTPVVQKAMAELVLLRLFYRLEAFLEEATIRICCGANYLDGSSAGLLVSSRGRKVAISNMRQLSRPKAIDLKWTIGTDMLNNVKFIIPSTDSYVSVVTNHSSELDRMRRVRNHIAHGNRDTSRKFRPVVEYYYGAKLPHITPGVLLLSPRFSPSVLSQAFVFARVFAKDLVKAP